MQEQYESLDRALAQQSMQEQYESFERAFTQQRTDNDEQHMARTMQQMSREGRATYAEVLSDENFIKPMSAV